MSLVIPATPVTTASANQCRLLWDNLFNYASSVVASSEDGDFPVENSYDWLVTDFFKPAAAGQYTITCTFSSIKTANCMAFYATDLQDNGGTIKLQYHDGSTWQDASDNITVSTGAPYIEYFDAQASTQWRFVIDSTPVSSIGVLFFGQYMGLEYGVWGNFTPPSFMRDNKYTTNVNQEGNFIGRSIVHNAGEITLNVEPMTMDWARSYWLPFIKHAEKSPFFFTWHNENYPTESAFCWSSNTSFRASNMQTQYMKSTLKMRVLTE